MVVPLFRVALTQRITGVNTTVLATKPSSSEARTTLWSPSSQSPQANPSTVCVSLRSSDISAGHKLAIRAIAPGATRPQVQPDHRLRHPAHRPRRTRPHPQSRHRRLRARLLHRLRRSPHSTPRPHPQPSRASSAPTAASAHATTSASSPPSTAPPP